jgi:hypothetical protein
MDMHTQESIALAAGLLGQAKGDIAAARRAAGEAHAWLCSIDASYKGEAKPAPVSDETRQRLEQQVRVLTEAKASAENEARHWNEAFKATDSRMRAAEAKVKQLEGELADHKGELRASAMRPGPTKPAPAPVPFEAVAQQLAPSLASKVAKPAPAPVADQFAHLPPAMREFARQAAAGKLEID